MPRLRPANLDHGGHSDASFPAAADGMVLGRTSHDNPFQRTVGAADAGKILISGAVGVIDRDTNQAKPRRKHAKYLDTRSGRIRLAMITGNSAASRSEE